jgi:hypothetical protein
MSGERQPGDGLAGALESAGRRGAAAGFREVETRSQGSPAPASANLRLLMLFLSSTSWSLGQVSFPVQAVVVLC